MDSARAERFAQRMTTLMNEGMLSVLVSMCHELGLFDTLDGMRPGRAYRCGGRPANSSGSSALMRQEPDFEIAASTCFWLAMSSGRGRASKRAFG